MKFSFLLLSLLSFNATANTTQSVFGIKSSLSSELQSEVISAVEERFPCVDRFGMKELSTTVVYDEIDQGITDEYYTTQIQVNYHFDYHPNTSVVTVKSILWDGSNPTIDWTDIESVEGSISCD